MALVYEVDEEGHPRPKVRCDGCGAVIKDHAHGFAVLDSSKSKPGTVLEPIFHCQGCEEKEQKNNPGRRSMPIDHFILNNIQLTPTQAASQPLRLSLEATTIAKLVGFVVTGMLCIITAVFTTVVESGGFWRYFWLGTCIFLFLCAVSFIILATKDGLRIDHAGLSFEPHDTSSVAEQKTG
jgi:hypothetical protein